MDDRPSILRTHLNQVLRQWRRTVLLQGIAITATAVVLLFGLCMGIDYLIGLGGLARGGLLVLSLAGIIAVAVRFLVRPVRRLPTGLQVARYVEERHPGFNDGLVSAVEFSDKPVDGTARLLLDRLMSQVAERSSGIDFTRTVDRARLRRTEGAAFLAIGFLAVFAVQDLDLFSRAAVRLFAPWTRPGSLLSTELRVTPGDVKLRRGGNQTVAVRVIGRLTPSVRLFFRIAGQEWESVETHEEDETGAFTYELVGIAERTEYYAEAGPAKSPTYTIAVFDEPQVERIDVTYHYPAYTGFPPKTEEDKGDITAPVGTSVTLTITTSKPIRSGELAFSNSKTQKLDTDGKTITGSLFVREDLSYKVKLLDEDGLTNSDPVEYYIRALPDQAPTVTILEPGRDKRVTPVEEVTIRATAEDDFGLLTFILSYSVNGGPERKIDLAAGSKKEAGAEGAGIVWENRHLLSLEELSVKPGDFVSYYAQASDRRGKDGTTSTDIYFLDIKPFEEEFQQGQGGGGNISGIMPGRLSQEQKEIIAATWRVERDRGRAAADQTRKDLNAIAQAQDRLKDRTDEAASTLRWESGMSEEMRKMADLLDKAVDPMERASRMLRSGVSVGALPPEREALQFLLQAEALIRRYMVSQSSNAMTSSAPFDQSDTSELELKRDMNKYETLDQAGQQQQRSQSVDEALQRVKDLARRQQQLNDQMRQLANEDRKSEAERKRELDRLTREQSQLRQEAEEVARSLSRQPSDRSSTDRSMQGAARDLRDSSEEMAQSARQLQRNSPSQAAGQGSRALQKLEEVDRQLQRAQSRSLEQMVRDAARRADQLATQQEQLTRVVEELKKEKDRGYPGIKSRVDALDNGRGGLNETDKQRRVDQFVRKRLNDVAEAKDRAGRELNRLNEDLRYLSGKAEREQPKVKQALDEASRDLNGNSLPQKVDRSKKLLNERSLDDALKTEQGLSKDLKRLADKVRVAQNSLILPDQERLTRARDQTQDALSNWQDLQRRMDRLQRNGQPGGDRGLAQAYRQQLQDMQNLARQLPPNSPQADDLRNQLRAASLLGNEPWKIDRAKWGQLSQGLARALSDVNTALNARIQSLIEKDKLHLAKDEDVPPQYRDLVNKYYEKLSKGQGQQK